MTHADWEETLQTNLLAPVRLDRAFLPQMLESKRGVIIPLASIQGTLPLHDSTLPYVAAKAGLINYSKERSKEVSPRGVRVLTVSPGWILTDAAQRMMERIAQRAHTPVEAATQRVMQALGGIPAGRPAYPLRSGGTRWPSRRELLTWPARRMSSPGPYPLNARR